MIKETLKSVAPEWALKHYALLRSFGVECYQLFYLLRNAHKCRLLSLPAIYADHMILQCNKPLLIQGRARVGSPVTVRIGDLEVQTRTPESGQWQVDLGCVSPGGPHVLEVRTPGKRLRYRDVYFGEVWICSGQSNMVVPIFSLNNEDTEKEMIRRTGGKRFSVPYRCCQVGPIDSMQPYSIEWKKRWMRWLINQHKYADVKGWNDCNRVIGDLSAIAYYYGLELIETLNIPLGLIVNPLGGSAEYGWIKRSLLEQHCPEILSDFFANSRVTEWMKRRACKNLGKHWNAAGQLHPYFPGYCYETYIRPIAGYGVRGVVWYAGESSAQLNEMGQYSQLMELLIRNWREHWGEEMPFYYAQLHGMVYERTFGAGLHYYYPEIREHQRRLLYRIPGIGMAVSYDLSTPDNTHFRRRKPMGERFARLALHYTYGRKEIVPNGPLYKEAEVVEGKVFIRFDDSDGLHPSDGETVRGFELADADRVFYPVEASVEGDSVVLNYPSGASPCYLHYAFEAYPVAANLVNGAGLPAAAFEVEMIRQG